MRDVVWKINTPLFVASFVQLCRFGLAFIALHSLYCADVPLRNFSLSQKFHGEYSCTSSDISTIDSVNKVRADYFFPNIKYFWTVDFQAMLHCCKDVMQVGAWIILFWSELQTL